MEPFANVTSKEYDGFWRSARFGSAFMERDDLIDFGISARRIGSTCKGFSGREV